MQEKENSANVVAVLRFKGILYPTVEGIQRTKVGLGIFAGTLLGNFVFSPLLHIDLHPELVLSECVLAAGYCFYAFRKMFLLKRECPMCINANLLKQNHSDSEASDAELPLDNPIDVVSDGRIFKNNFFVTKVTRDESGIRYRLIGSPGKIMKSRLEQELSLDREDGLVLKAKVQKVILTYHYADSDENREILQNLDRFFKVS